MAEISQDDSDQDPHSEHRHDAHLLQVREIQLGHQPRAARDLHDDEPRIALKNGPGKCRTGLRFWDRRGVTVGLRQQLLDAERVRMGCCE